MLALQLRACSACFFYFLFYFILLHPRHCLGVEQSTVKWAFLHQSENKLQVCPQANLVGGIFSIEILYFYMILKLASN